jgi:3-hydroxyisobutyrate dehydrogenase-like beta-hydroxyacid dehydrogenase
MKIAFIGFGEAARSFTDSLQKLGSAKIIAAYDLKADSTIAATANARGVALKPSAGEAIADADWIISAVTADQSFNAATAVMDALSSDQLFIDINSVSPDRKKETAAIVEKTGAAYLDMAVMAPVDPRGHQTPVLLAGATADKVTDDMRSLGFNFEVIGPEPGAATAIKMVRSLFVKGLEALTVETMLAASASGCFDYVLSSLSASYPGLGWPQNVNYMFERTLRHGARRAAEMRESAATLDALGLTGALADKIADVQASMGAVSAQELPQGPLPAAVAEILSLRLSAHRS